MKIYLIFFALIIFLVSSVTAKIPSFIHTCNKNDPKLNECALRNANIAIPGLVKGKRELGLPKMTPLHIPRIDIQAGNNLKIELTDNEVHGLDTTKVTAVDLQLEKMHMVFRVTIPAANIIGHYKMDGKILILPIKGEGPANITLENGDYIYTMNFMLKQRDKKEYLSITDHNIVFTTTRAYYHFENLFGGDSTLANEMNRFLNENWSEVTKDLGSTVGETISSIITSIATTIFDKIPFDEILPA